MRVHVQPQSLEEAASAVREAAAVAIGSEAADRAGASDLAPAPTFLDPGALRGPVEITPENLSAEFLAGTTVAEVEAHLAPLGLWWPVDAAPGRTLGAVIATAGPHPGRTGYGPVRDWVLGLEAVLAGGARMRFGAPTMKNVAGYDLTRLMVGSRGTLALIASATLRLLPRPEWRATVLLHRSDWRRAFDLAAACEWDGERLLARVDGREEQVRRRLNRLGGELVSDDAWDPWYARCKGRYVSRPEPDWSACGAPLLGLWRTSAPVQYSALEQRLREAVAPGRCFNPHI